MSTPQEKIIDPRELRIGNYLLYEGKIVHVTALSLDIDDEYEEQILFCELGKTTDEKGGWNRAIAGKLERIPVTEEWMLKLGFKKIDSGYVKEGFNTIADYGGQFISLFEGGATLEFGYYENQLDCSFVHRLQNLYFVIMGEELKLTP